MTLDEVIKYCEEVAEKERSRAHIHEDMMALKRNIKHYVEAECHEALMNEHIKCADEHKQLAEWLTDYKRLKEQEPCEDAISRAEALKMIDDISIPEDMSTFEIKSHIGVEISTLPPVTPKRKVGEWIKKNNDYFDWYECSECGYGSDGEMKYNRLCDVRTKFCPDCGSQNLKGE